MTYVARGVLLGFDVSALLLDRDPTRQIVVEAALVKADRMRRENNEELAAMIANAVGKLFKA